MLAFLSYGVSSSIDHLGACTLLRGCPESAISTISGSSGASTTGVTDHTTSSGSSSIYDFVCLDPMSTDFMGSTFLDDWLDLGFLFFFLQGSFIIDLTSSGIWSWIWINWLPVSLSTHAFLQHPFKLGISISTTVFLIYML